jgi:hypothetical protein
MPGRLRLTITLDLFLGDWNRNGNLWACVQPHIVGDSQFSSLPAWLNTATGADLEYEMAAYDPAAPTDGIVPVPFAPDLNLSIDLLNGDPPLTIDRVNRFRILDPTGLRALNQQVRDDPNLPQPSKNPAPNTPFAAAYVDGLRRQSATRAADETAQLLDIAFTGGVPQFFTAATVAVPADAGVMELPSLNGVRRTNLHSMIGHMVLIGRRANIAHLNAVTDFRIVLHTGPAPGQGDVWRQDLSATSGGPGIPAFFANLRDQNMDEGQLSLTWAPNFERRAYARRAQTAFRLHLYGNVSVFERRAGAKQANQHTLGKILRTIVTLPAPGAGDLPGPPTLPNTLRMRPCRIIDGKIERYRSAPAGTPLQPIDTVLRFVASRDEQDDLEQLLDADPDLFAGVTPRGTIVADAGSQPYQFIGRWTFPWDQDSAGTQRSTLLFFGRVPQSATSFLIIEPARGGAAFNVRLDPAGLQPSTTRWTGTPPAGVEAGFDGFFAPDLNAGLERLLVTAEFQNDYDFDLAQSAGMIEGVVTAACDHPPLLRPQDVTPANDYLGSLVNYNALNLYGHGTPTSDGPLNLYSELYPLYKERTAAAPPAVNDRISQAFHFRYLLPTLQLPTDAIPQQFFAALYSSLAQPRTIMPELEHTYAVTIGFPARAQPQYADFRVQLPAIAPFTASGGDASIERPFLTADYVRDASGSESLTFSANLPLLADQYLNDARYRDFHIAAWRAVAELASAHLLQLQIDAFDFSVFQAINLGGVLANGLVPAPAPIPLIDITNLLKQRAQHWLVGDLDTTRPERIPLALTPPAPIWREAYVAAFSLIVTRDDKAVPQLPAAAWDLRNMPAPVADPNAPVADQGGMITTPADAGSQAPFERWLARLKSGRMPLPSMAPDTKLQSALQVEPDGSAPGSPDSGVDVPNWIAPGGPADPWPGSAVVTICPFGFRPIQPNRWFGPTTDTLLRRYLRLLEAVLRLDVPWWSERTATQWRIYFNGLPALLQAPNGALYKLQAAVLALLFPMPNPENPHLPPEIRDIVQRLRDAMTPTAKRAVAEVGALLASDFGLFSDAKAFLHLHIAGQNSALSRDFFDCASEKQIGFNQSSDAPHSTDRSVLNYTSGRLDDNGGGLEFVELLQDTKFDDAFTYSSFTLRRFEYFVNHLEDPTWSPLPTLENDYFIPSRLLAPGGQVTPGRGPEIYLASREPLIKPQHLFTGMIRECQTADDFTNTFQTAAQFDYATLKVGGLRAPMSGKPYAQVVAQSAPRPRGTAADEYILSAAFVVYGNEDEQTPTEAFGLDKFYIDLPAQPAAGGPLPNDGQPSEQTLAIYQKLASTADPRTLLITPDAGPPPTIADDIFATNLLESTTRWLAAITPGKTPIPDAPVAYIREDGTLAVLWRGHREAWVADAVLFKVVDPSGSSTPQTLPTYVLLANREVQVWNRSYLGLVQTRNPSDLSSGLDFAGEFGQVSEEASDTAPFQPVRDVPAALPPITVPQRTWHLSELVAKILQDRLIPTDPKTNQARGWNQFDVVVTVNHDQQLPMAGRWYDPSTGGEKHGVGAFDSSSYPLSAYRLKSSALDATLIDLPTPYVDFRIDFQWSTASNLQFYRLSDVLVKVTS